VGVLTKSGVEKKAKVVKEFFATEPAEPDCPMIGTADDRKRLRNRGGKLRTMKSGDRIQEPEDLNRRKEILTTNGNGLLRRFKLKVN
jgi:hypothetical protein